MPKYGFLLRAEIEHERYVQAVADRLMGKKRETWDPYRTPQWRFERDVDGSLYRVKETING